jgi:hypothetical protein
MTHDDTGDGTARGTSPLLRRVDGIELPVASPWNVPGSHANIVFSVPRRLQRPRGVVGRARVATLVFSDDPGDVLVVVLFDAPGLAEAGSSAFAPPIHLEARSLAGPQRWALWGEVFPETGVLPLRATLGYHEVWRRGDRAYGWFVLAGTIGPAANGTQRRLRFSFDLLADGPHAGSPPATALSRSRGIRAASQTSGAA